MGKFLNNFLGIIFNHFCKTKIWPMTTALLIIFGIILIFLAVKVVKIFHRLNESDSKNELKDDLDQLLK